MRTLRILSFSLGPILRLYLFIMVTAVAQWLLCCATNRKVTGAIPDSVIRIRSHFGPGVDSASNRNEYQEYFVGVKTAGA